MSSACAGLPTSFDRFGAIWHVDFEFRQDENHQPVPVTMCAREHLTPAQNSTRRESLLYIARPPFDIGTETFIVAYSIVAEFTCFRVPRWPLPRRALCAYFE